MKVTGVTDWATFEAQAVASLQAVERDMKACITFDRPVSAALKAQCERALAEWQSGLVAFIVLPEGAQLQTFEEPPVELTARTSPDRNWYPFAEVVRAIPKDPGWSLSVDDDPLRCAKQLRLWHRDGRRAELSLPDTLLLDDRDRAHDDYVRANDLFDALIAALEPPGHDEHHQHDKQDQHQPTGPIAPAGRIRPGRHGPHQQQHQQDQQHGLNRGHTRLPFRSAK